jgi:hydroxybutyrate-dimer hydrolase
MHHEARPARRASLAPAPLSAMAALVAVLAGCSSSNSPSVNQKPDFVVNPTSIHYDGVNDDLLTGGVGRGGLGGSCRPSSPTRPRPRS